MPQPNEILAGLQSIASLTALAIGWHVLLLGALSTLLLGWRPSRRVAGLFLVLPLVSVSALAFGHANPFNGAVFAVIAVVLGFTAARAEPEPVERAARWAVLAGVALVAFAWVYPHFGPTTPKLAVLLAAPMGLIPCPTLSLLMGLTLAGGSPRSRTWFFVLGMAGLFYGFIGVVRLGVMIDLVLMAGAFVMLAMAGRKEEFFHPPAMHA